MSELGERDTTEERQRHYPHEVVGLVTDGVALKVAEQVAGDVGRYLRFYDGVELSPREGSFATYNIDYEAWVLNGPPTGRVTLKLMDGFADSRREYMTRPDEPGRGLSEMVNRALLQDAIWHHRGYRQTEWEAPERWVEGTHAGLIAGSEDSPHVASFKAFTEEMARRMNWDAFTLRHSFYKASVTRDEEYANELLGMVDQAFPEIPARELLMNMSSIPSPDEPSNVVATMQALGIEGLEWAPSQKGDATPR